MTAPSAPDYAVQKKFATAGDASCPGAPVFSPVAANDDANVLTGWPIVLGRIPVLHDDHSSGDATKLEKEFNKRPSRS